MTLFFSIASIQLYFVFSPWKQLLMLATDGFFDAGMLLQALKARGEGFDEASKPSERATVHARRREIGKRLRLSEY
jgi:hypothetical protein